MPRRSRGCRECLNRRIGCDGAIPSCRQCLITNRSCSGPVQGSIFIDQTRRVTSRLNQSRKQIGAVVRQPSHRAIASLAFVSEFISSVATKTATPSRSAWLIQLESIPQDQRGPALDLALQAVAFAYCGSEAKNHTSLMESARLYGEAMLQHSKAVSQRSKVLDPAVLYTSIILSLFETMWSSDAAAYAMHINAAREMLSLVDWQVAQNDMLSQVAVLVQNQTLLLMILSPLGDTQVDLGTSTLSDTIISGWEQSQSAADQLTTQLFRLWKHIYGQNVDSDVDSGARRLQNIASRIEEIWRVFENEAILRGDTFPRPSAQRTVYRDNVTALMEAYFAAAQVMLSLAGPLAPSYSFLPSANPCQSILTSASYLLRKKTSIGCVGHDMFLPLTLVALHGPSLKGRRLAYNFLRDRVRGLAFEGLGKMVLQRASPIGSKDAVASN